MKTVVKKLFLIAIIILGANVNNNAYSQDGTGGDSDCWCKYVTKDVGVVVVVNIDSMIQKNQSGWRNLKGCEGEVCGGTCSFEHKVCSGGTCEWKKLEGVCTTEKYGEEVPWATDKETVPRANIKGKSCDCIGVFKTDNYIVYTNVTNEIENQDPDSPTQIKMARECKGDCGSSNCVYATYNYTLGSVIIREGLCRDDWPLDDLDSTETEIEKRGMIHDTMISDLEGNIVEMDESLSFSPNPATNQIFIKGPENTKTTIFNIAGEIIIESNQLTVNISELTSGIYIVVMETETSVMTNQLVVE